MNEPKMCIKAVLDIVDDMGIEDPGFDSKILDFAAGKGQIGELLTEQGFTEIYGQEGSEPKIHFLRRVEGVYKDIQMFIVGKQGLP